MISEKLQNALNEQITAELWSSNLYLQMAFYLEKEGWDGFAHWLYKQAEEERGHALAFAHYLAKRGGAAKVSKIDEVPANWKSVKDIFDKVAEHEHHVSNLVDEVVKVASSEKDNATQDFLWGFVREQVEEEATAAAIVSKIEKAHESGLLFLDSEMAKR